MTVEIIIRPRATMAWGEFCQNSAPKSIALDGMVSGGPAWDERSLRANFDHHSGVVREATMSTAMQVMFAIKGGLMKRLGGTAFVWINDPDQDTALATWLLQNHRLFDGVQSHPAINRLLALNDRLDITGGSYPMRLDDDVLMMHNWIFQPYSDMRRSGVLANADASTMRTCLDAVHRRIGMLLIGQAGRLPMRTDAKVLYESPYGYSIIDETGGNEARYAMFANGLNAFVSIVSVRQDGRRVYSIGRRSQYIDFPVKDLYAVLNEAENRDGRYGAEDPDQTSGWGGSDIIGGSPRLRGSRLREGEIAKVIDGFIRDRLVK